MLDFAPRLVANRIDDAFDFSSQKKDQVRESLKIEIKENRKYLATNLISIFKLIEQKVLKENPTPSSLIETFNVLAKFEREALQKFKGTVQVTLSHLSRKEIENFRDFQIKKIEDDVNNIATSEKLNEKIYDRYESFFEFFLDSLNEDQKVEIKNFIKIHEPYYRYQNSQRKLYIEKFVNQAILGLPGSSPQLQQQNHGVLTTGEPAAGERADLEEIFIKQFSIPEFDILTPPEKKQFAIESIDLVLKVWSLSKPRQKQQMQEELTNHIESLQEILNSP